MGLVGSRRSRFVVEGDVRSTRQNDADSARIQIGAQVLRKRERKVFLRSGRIQHGANVRAAVGWVQQH